MLLYCAKRRKLPCARLRGKLSSLEALFYTVKEGGRPKRNKTVKEKLRTEWKDIFILEILFPYALL